ncbi:YncE family protein [Virgibacillus ihumii]|uniref:YncE family protein n=1 Tax=Virgibacillus ihumii TaxID=2686091 RepID=UPI001FECEBED|nr:YncE family protein [Virgibacillus ihumii]
MANTDSLLLELILSKNVQVLSEATLEIQGKFCEPRNDFQSNRKMNDPSQQIKCIQTQRVHDWIFYCTDHQKRISIPEDCVEQIRNCRDTGNDVTTDCEGIPDSSNFTVLSESRKFPGIPGIRIVSIRFTIHIRVQFKCNDTPLCHFEVPVTTVDEVALCIPKDTSIAATISNVDCTAFSISITPVCTNPSITLNIPEAVTCTGDITGTVTCNDAPVPGTAVTFSPNPVVTDENGEFTTAATIPEGTAPTAVSITASTTVNDIPAFETELTTVNCPSCDVLAYVTNAGEGENTVSFIDTSTNTVINTVTVGNTPFGVAITPDGTRVYVTNQGDDTVSVIDTVTNTVVATVMVGNGPISVAITPDGTRAYVANANDDTVSVIDTVTVGALPFGVAITPDGTRVYVANSLDDTISVIDTATNTVIDTIPVGNSPNSVAITPDGTRAYVTNADAGTVSVINTATNMVIDTVMVGNDPRRVAITPDGTRAYVTNRANNTVSVIDTASNTVVATVTVGNAPNSVAITPDGARAYVTNLGDANVSVIDTATNTVIDTVTVGDVPRGIAIGTICQG